MALEQPTLSAHEHGPNVIEGAGLGLHDAAQALAGSGSTIPFDDRSTSSLSSLGSELVRGVRRRRRAS